MPHVDPRVDAYIANAAPFAQPILRHLRALVHAACPEVEETLRWSMPSFTYRGKILCHIAAFKAHCAVGFWHRQMTELLEVEFGKTAEAMGAMGRITALDDLPSDKKMKQYVRHAMALLEAGVPARAVERKPRPAARVPADLAAALKKNRKAAGTFHAFSPSHRREYIEWITEAKREETRQQRLTTTLEWLAAGKSRNWKYK